MFKNYRKTKQFIGGKKYTLFVANTNNKKRKGLSGIRSLPRNFGMLFPYSEEISNRSFTMKNVYFPLRIIFFDKNMKFVYQEVGRPGQLKSIVCEKPSMYVIEILY